MFYFFEYPIYPLFFLVLLTCLVALGTLIHQCICLFILLSILFVLIANYVILAQEKVVASHLEFKCHFRMKNFN